jgi:hypothetical protein
MKTYRASIGPVGCAMYIPSAGLRLFILISHDLESPLKRRMPFILRLGNFGIPPFSSENSRHQSNDKVSKVFSFVSLPPHDFVTHSYEPVSLKLSTHGLSCMGISTDVIPILLLHHRNLLKEFRGEFLLRSSEGGDARSPWHLLYFLPLLHGHGSLRPTFPQPSCDRSLRLT